MAFVQDSLILRPIIFT